MITFSFHRACHLAPPRRRFARHAAVRRAGEGASLKSREKERERRVQCLASVIIYYRRPFANLRRGSRVSLTARAQSSCNYVARLQTKTSGTLRHLRTGWSENLREPSVYKSMENNRGNIGKMISSDDRRLREIIDVYRVSRDLPRGTR